MNLSFLSLKAENCNANGRQKKFDAKVQWKVGDKLIPPSGSYL